MLASTVLALLLQSIVSAANAIKPPGSNIVDTGYARYLGNHTFPNAVAYLGIPYAEPPLGELRFRAPVPLNETRISVDANGRVVDARSYAQPCIQASSLQGDAGGAGSEDCLKVNVYAPVGVKKGDKLPVLVYFHGGGYFFGNPATYPMDHWVNQTPNVVLITVAYRLAAFGFLSVPEFRDSSNGDFNAGLLDEIEALKWVQKNVASFGGDPKKVTINGESAGGTFVELHLVIKQSKGLFSSGIAQSVYRTPLPTPEQNKPMFEYFANAVGCGTGPVALQLACLRKADISSIARAQDAVNSPAFNGSEYKAFRVVVDGKYITDYPTKLIQAGQFTKVPLIVGSTTNETVPILPTFDITEALTTYFPALPEADVKDIAKEYAPEDFASDLLRNQTVIGDSELRCARTIMGTAMDNHGVKTWTYRYNQRNPTQDPSLGVTHESENWFLFRGTNRGFNGTTTFSPMNPVEISFAEEMIAYWISFVRAGNPNTFKLKRSPTWPRYTLNNRTRIVLQQSPVNSTTITGSFLEKETTTEVRRCEVVASKVEGQEC
ncbi:Alpha/Beta hydrolase protein [Crucibulum laeve]|uniref:Carboxylic ester hydrolase n=1 Tax=Crucibulum laeve TaxID=68775 RepID=A0A5C3LL82_9AGAR|nr:Alpha/Beta hydrolase protein [Crucibulum laeve]